MKNKKDSYKSEYYIVTNLLRSKPQSQATFGLGIYTYVIKLKTEWLISFSGYVWKDTTYRDWKCWTFWAESLPYDYVFGHMFICMYSIKLLLYNCYISKF